MKHEEFCPPSHRPRWAHEQPGVPCPFCEAVRKEREACAVAVEELERSLPDRVRRAAYIRGTIAIAIRGRSK